MEGERRIANKQKKNIPVSMNQGQVMIREGIKGGYQVIREIGRKKE